MKNNVIAFLVIMIVAVSFAMYLARDVSANPAVGLIIPTRADKQDLREQDGPVFQAAAVLLPVSQPAYLPIRDFTIAEPLINARAAIAYDMRSGRTLFAKNADDRLPIASITKVMTAVAVTETLNLDAQYQVSREDLNLDGSGADFTSGEKFQGRDLLKAMLIESSNDAAAVFVSAAYKENIDLLKYMNDKAAELGMKNTQYNDPAGLDDEKTYSTANDQVALFKYVTMQHPEIWKILSMPSDQITSVDGGMTHYLTTTNKIIGKVAGFVGGKTGITEGALGTMSAVVKVNEKGDNIIAIVLGTNDRFIEISQLINWAEAAHTW